MNTLKTIDEAIVMHDKMLESIVNNPNELPHGHLHSDVFKSRTNLKALRDKLGSEGFVEEVATSIAASHDRAYEMKDYDFRKIYRMEAKAAIKAMGV